MPFPDGRSLTSWEDENRFLAEIAGFSKRDAENYPRYDAFVEQASAVMDRFILRQPPSFAEFAAEFRTPEEARIFQKMVLGSAADVVHDEDEQVGKRVAVEVAGSHPVHPERGRKVRQAQHDGRRRKRAVAVPEEDVDLVRDDAGHRDVEEPVGAGIEMTGHDERIVGNGRDGHGRRERHGPRRRACIRA